MSADIIQFIPRPKQTGESTDFPAIAFRSPKPDGISALDIAKVGLKKKHPPERCLVTDHVDTAPCEYVQPDWSEK